MLIKIILHYYTNWCANYDILQNTFFCLRSKDKHCTLNIYYPKFYAILNTSCTFFYAILFGLRSILTFRVKNADNIIIKYHNQ